jgi:outer membrane protein TolC
MIRIRMIVVALGIAAIAGAAAAEELTLADAIEIGLTDSPTVAAAEAEVESAAHGIRAAGSAAWPTLLLSGSYGTFDGDVRYGRFIPGVPGDGTFPVGPYDRNATAGVELKQVLYAGGGISSAKKASAVVDKLANEGLRERRRELSFEVTRAFYQVLLAERRAAVAAKSVERSQEGLDMIELRFAEQEALKVELLGAEGQLAADRLALLEATNDLGLARSSLNRLLGRPLDQAVSLEGSLDDRMQVPDESVGVESAATSNPVVRMAGLGAEKADAALGSARSLSRPKLELAAVYTWIDNDLFFKGQYGGAVINLSIPFFQDVRAGSAAKSQARAQKARADAMVADATSAMTLHTIAAYRALEQSLAAVDALTKNLDYHRERYRVTRSGYREEMVTFAEVLDRHDDLRQAELGLSAALFEARIKEAEIRRLAGSG